MVERSWFAAISGYGKRGRLQIDGPAFRRGQLPRIELPLARPGTTEQFRTGDSRFAAPAAAGGAGLYLALYENRLSSRVAAGANAQRTLRHDHACASWSARPTMARPAALQAATRWKAAGIGVAAFVECAQAVGIDLPLKALVWEDATRHRSGSATTTPPGWPNVTAWRIAPPSAI